MNNSFNSFIENNPFHHVKYAFSSKIQETKTQQYHQTL